MIIGEGILRECCGCFILMGCYHPDDNEQSDCSTCKHKACPDTDEKSHGICQVCFERARSKKK